MLFKDWKMQPQWYRATVLGFLGLLSIGAVLVYVRVGRAIENNEQRSFSTVEARIAAEELISILKDTTSSQYRTLRDVSKALAKDTTYITRDELKNLISGAYIDKYEVDRRQDIHEQRQADINREVMRKLDLALVILDELRKSK